MKLHLISGFLGSGKTTAITNASVQLKEKGILAGVITNDQGSYLVDSSFAIASDIPTAEVTGGCFCCNFFELGTQLNHLIETSLPTVVFAESVGSCTDLVATVLKPLIENKQKEISAVSFSVFVDSRLLLGFLQDNSIGFNNEISYIFEKQIEEATVLVINKIDLLSTEQFVLLKALTDKNYKQKIVLYQNSLSKESIEIWLETINNIGNHPHAEVLDIDYDIYGKGEADLAWLDEEIEIETKDAFPIAIEVIEKIYNQLNSQQISIGHLKFLISNSMDAIKISFTAVPESDWKDGIKYLDGTEISLMVNIRAQTSPENLRNIVLNIINELNEKPNVNINEYCVSAFKPGFPNPTFRYAS